MILSIISYCCLGLAGILFLVDLYYSFLSIWSDDDDDDDVYIPKQRKLIGLIDGMPIYKDEDNRYDS
jgi:hypothetical protein